MEQDILTIIRELIQRIDELDELVIPSKTAERLVFQFVSARE